jgi:hypothetical protein
VYILKEHQYGHESVTPYSLLEIYRRFGGTYGLQFGSSCNWCHPAIGKTEQQKTGRTTSEWRLSRVCNAVGNTAHKSNLSSALRRPAPPQSTTISACHNYDVIKCSRHCCDITAHHPQPAISNFPSAQPIPHNSHHCMFLATQPATYLDILQEVPLSIFYNILFPHFSYIPSPS